MIGKSYKGKNRQTSSNVSADCTIDDALLMGPEGNIVTLHVHEGAVSYYISLSRQLFCDWTYCKLITLDEFCLFLIIEKKILKIGLQMYVKIELRE